MIYFIPSWYTKDDWKENEQSWYARRLTSEIDDSVKQIQLFQRNSISDYKIMLLSYAPNFRHFLHRQSIYRAPYWSVFDAIQEVKRKKASILLYQDLNWPDNVEFVYTPFAVIANLNGTKYAQMEFGDYGNLFKIDLFKDETLSRTNYYDDRGFVSCSTIYKNGAKAYDQFLNENGVWKLCRFADGRVIINPDNKHYLMENDGTYQKCAFKSLSYKSLEEVIEEVLSAFLKTTSKDDIFSIAASNQHIGVVNNCLDDCKDIYTIFANRIKIEADFIKKINKADVVVVDTEANYRELVKTNIIEKERIRIINPYDTRTDYGISQKLTVQKILVTVDDLEESHLEKIIVSIAGYLLRNKDARVHLFTRYSDYDRETVLLDKVRDILSKNHYPKRWARKETEKKFEVIPEEERVPVLFFVEKCINDISISKCVREQRILVDLAKKPDIFLQIACVSVGVPQIVATETNYIQNGKNGRINHNIDKLADDLSYYLDNLNNWNDAMINSYKIGKENTSERLVEQWKEVLEYIGQD